MDPTTFLRTFLFTTSIIYTTFRLLRKRRTPPLPPGPIGLPLVGTLPFLDPSLHTYFAGLSKKYGPISSLRLGSKLVVVISSSSLARAILREHDDTFANHDPPLAALISSYGGRDIAWTPNGPTWRMLRRVCVHETIYNEFAQLMGIQMLSPSSLDALLLLRQQEVRSTIRHIHAKSGTLVDIGIEVFLNVMNILTNTMWGEALDQVEEGQERESVGKDFKALVTDVLGLFGQPNVSDFFPALARFDLQGIQSKMELLKEKLDRIFEAIIEKKSTGTGTDQSGRRTKDFLDFLLKLEKEGGDNTNPLTRTHVKALLMNLFLAGIDTTSATIEWAMAEILNKPDILKKLHEELNQVVGKGSLVEEHHLPQLHFLSLVIKETLRLHPAVPLLVPHRPSSPCTINGYLIPEGARVFVNVWAIQTDPSLWTDPEEFKPERYLQEGFQRDFTGKDFDYLPFGSGRRICAGVAMADKLLGYLLAAILHSFDWSLPKGEQVVDLSEKFGIVMKKAAPLLAIPTPRLSRDELYC